MEQSFPDSKVHRPRLKIDEQEFKLIEIARKKTKQSRTGFVTKAAVDRARKVVREYSNYQEGVEEALK